MGITTVGVFAEQDKLSLHRFKADEAYLIGEGLGPVEAYLSISEIMRVARLAGVDAIHPGYGFLSENPEFAEACAREGFTFIGPSPEVLRSLGDKVSARSIAIAAHVPVMPASPPLPDDPEEILQAANTIGLPVMVKASWGGGGRGMRPIAEIGLLVEAVTSAKRESMSAFGRDEVYLEKLVKRARHIEVQVLGDTYGNVVHLFDRDCSVQRRNQKIIERAPAENIPFDTRQAMFSAAVAIARTVGYCGAGTVEFLLDTETGAFYFIEVNPRIQVEHTVTEVVTGIDLVKAQILIAEGGHLGKTAETGVPPQTDINCTGHALQCRITTENPENNFIPDYGRITAYRGAFGFGIRIDGGTAYAGAIVTRFYDPLLEKITAWAPDPIEATMRMQRALSEYRIRGIATNVPFLEEVLRHSDFRENNCTTKFVDETPELFRHPVKRDRATRLLTYIADVSVNGHPDLAGRQLAQAPSSISSSTLALPPARGKGFHSQLEAMGARDFTRSLRGRTAPLITDTTMRDAHQSLLATRMRTRDIVGGADLYARLLPDLFSLECWGGATFDVAMRFLNEDPWERLALVRARCPDMLLQMLLRGANAVGYKNYPDNVVRYFIAQAAEAGIDIFRIFDCFNWVENMRVAIDAVVESGKIAQGAICYTGDLSAEVPSKYDLTYYVNVAVALENAGCHMLAIKDMAGLLKPRAATSLIKALRDVTGLPIQLHTHDTSGIAAATVLAAIEAGVDGVDLATDALSGTTSQPCLGSIVEALKGSDRDAGLDSKAIQTVSTYWEKVRSQYSAFETDLRSGASEVYLHEMPGGQFTNLKEQARATGLEHRWPDVARAYHDANLLFGDIVKVTPSSKVVGDMALAMVAQELSPEEVIAPASKVDFPQSVVEMLRGDLGTPHGGWPDTLRSKVLGEAKPLENRPGAYLPLLDLEEEHGKASSKCGRRIDEREFASYLMYPKVFEDFCAASRRFGAPSVLPTSVYFHGMAAGQEVTVELEPGKSLIVRLLAIGDVDEDGMRRVFFELNGQARTLAVADGHSGQGRAKREKAEDSNPLHVGAPMPGLVSIIRVRPGQEVSEGMPMLTVEAMKMEMQINAPVSGRVHRVLVKPGEAVEPKDLLIELQPG